MAVNDYVRFDPDVCKEAQEFRRALALQKEVNEIMQSTLNWFNTVRSTDTDAGNEHLATEFGLPTTQGSALYNAVTDLANAGKNTVAKFRPLR